MKLQTIINRKINKLYRDYEKLGEIKSIDILDRIINEYSLLTNDLKDEDILKLSDNDINELISLIYDDNLNNKKEEQIRLIKVVLKGKYEKKLNIDLTSSQETLLIEFKDKLKNKVYLYNQEKIKNSNNSEKRSILEEQILSLEIILEKLNNGESKEDITLEEFNTLYELIIESDDITYKMKKDLLIQINSYNKDIINEQELDIIDDIISLLKTYDFKNLNESDIDLYRKEIINNIDIENAKEIISIFDSENILNKFNTRSILAICLYGDVDSIKEYIDYLYKNNKINSQIIYETPSLWINNLKSNTKMRYARYNKKDKNLIKSNSLWAISHSISLGEMEENIEYLTSLGFDVSINMSNNKVLKTPNQKIRRNFEIYKLYNVLTDENIKDFKVPALAYSDIINKLDMFTELGLLNGYNNLEYSRFVNSKTSYLSSFNMELYPILYKLQSEVSQDDYYKVLFHQTNHSERLKASVYKNNLGYEINNSQEYNDFVNKEFINLDEVGYISNKSIFDNIVNRDTRFDYDNQILDEEIIKELESTYKKNDYLYEINGRKISRIKVLRVLSILKSNNIELNKETLIYAISKNTFMTKETFDELSETIGYDYKGEYNNGILKNI